MTLLAAVTNGGALPSDLITPASFAGLLGLTAVTLVVSNTAQQVANFNPKWFALLVAIIATEIGVYGTGSRDWVMYILGILNGCLVFLSAAGANGAAAPKRAGASLGILPGPSEPQRRRRTFTDPWF